MPIALGTSRARAALVSGAMLVALACGSDGGTGPGEPQPEPLVITTGTLPAAVVDEPYTGSVIAEGGDGGYFWELVSGGLPPGLDLEVEDLPTNDVLITGTPSSAGTFDFTLRVSKDDGQSTTRTFMLAVLAERPDLAIQRALLPPGLVGGSYEAPLRPTGGDGSYDWSVASGALPPGLSLTSDGRIRGQPTSTDTSTFTIRLRSGGFSVERTYRVPVVAHRTGRYDITTLTVVEVPASIRPHLDAALERWQDVISGDLGAVAIPVDFLTGDFCGGFGDGVNGTAADDMILLINIVSIDGPAKILGQAGPCGLRGSDLPFAGRLTLDADDLEPLVGTQKLTDLITHEIGHAVGFGTIWDRLDLLAGAGTNDPRFTGARAIAEFRALGGTGDVPLENEGGEGTIESHWREAVFSNELMTGFIEATGVAQPLSRVSVASIEDLGYQVDYSAADGFVLGAPSGLSALYGTGTAAYDVALGGRVRILDERGARTVELR